MSKIKVSHGHINIHMYVLYPVYQNKPNCLTLTLQEGDRELLNAEILHVITDVSVEYPRSEALKHPALQAAAAPSRNMACISTYIATAELICMIELCHNDARHFVIIECRHLAKGSGLKFICIRLMLFRKSGHNNTLYKYYRNCSGNTCNVCDTLVASCATTD